MAFAVASHTTASISGFARPVLALILSLIVCLAFAVAHLACVQPVASPTLMPQIRVVVTESESESESIRPNR